MADQSFHFAHYKLDAYRVARELADLVMEITRRVPEGHGKLVDQIVRAATGAEALIAEGADTDTIARSLVISPQTARTHIQNILNKLSVHSRLEAAALVTQSGISADLIPAR